MPVAKKGKRGVRGEEDDGAGKVNSISQCYKV